MRKSKTETKLNATRLKVSCLEEIESRLEEGRLEETRLKAKKKRTEPKKEEATQGERLHAFLSHLVGLKVGDTISI